MVLIYGASVVCRRFEMNGNEPVHLYTISGILPGQAISYTAM